MPIPMKKYNINKVKKPKYTFLNDIVAKYYLEYDKYYQITFVNRTQAQKMLVKYEKLLDTKLVVVQTKFSVYFLLRRNNHESRQKM